MLIGAHLKESCEHKQLVAFIFLTNTKTAAAATTDNDDDDDELQHGENGLLHIPHVHKEINTWGFVCVCVCVSECECV